MSKDEFVQPIRRLLRQAFSDIFTLSDRLEVLETEHHRNKELKETKRRNFEIKSTVCLDGGISFRTV